MKQEGWFSLSGSRLTSIWNGEVVGGYLSTTFPFLSTRNFSKFHLTKSPKNPPELDFKNWYTGAVLGPLTSTCCQKTFSALIIYEMFKRSAETWYCKTPNTLPYQRLEIQLWNVCKQIALSLDLILVLVHQIDYKERLEFQILEKKLPNSLI